VRTIWRRRKSSADDQPVISSRLRPQPLQIAWAFSAQIPLQGEATLLAGGVRAVMVFWTDRFHRQAEHIALGIEARRYRRSIGPVSMEPPVVALTAKRDVKIQLLRRRRRLGGR